MQKSQVTEEMIVKVLTGQASEPEVAAVNAWKQANEGNFLRFSQYEALWEASFIEKPADTDTELAWVRMKEMAAGKGENKRKPAIAWKSVHVWRIAAILILSAGALGAFYTHEPAEQVQLVQTPQSTESKTALAPTNPEQKMEAPGNPEVVSTKETRLPTTVKEGNVKIDQPEREDDQVNIPSLITQAKVEEPIINTTLCPLEICIRQTFTCGDHQAMPYAYCSVLQPDQHGELHYAVPELAEHSCEATVDEITIRRVSTGETIVLTATSSPVTAGEFFDYIRGERTGPVVAGVFEADCDNLCMNDPIKLDNQRGSLVLH